MASFDARHEKTQQMLRLEADKFLNAIKQLLDHRDEDLERILSRYVQLELSLKQRLPTLTDHVAFLDHPSILDGLAKLISEKHAQSSTPSRASVVIGNGGAFSRGFPKVKYVLAERRFRLTVSYKDPADDCLLRCAKRADGVTRDPTWWVDWCNHQLARDAKEPAEREFVLIVLRDGLKMSPWTIAKQMGLRPVSLKEAIEFGAANPEDVLSQFEVVPYGPLCQKPLRVANTGSDDHDHKYLRFYLELRSAPVEGAPKAHLFVKADLAPEI